MENPRSEGVVEPLGIKEPDIYCVLFTMQGAKSYGVCVLRDDALQEAVYRGFVGRGSHTFKMSADELEGAIMGDFGEPPQVLYVIQRADFKHKGIYLDLGVVELPFWLWCELQTTYSKEAELDGWTVYRINRH